MGMKIEKTSFGSITIDGKTYDHDVLIDMGGKVRKRKKKLSKEKYGTSHILSLEEARYVLEKGCTTLILGAGQEGLSVRLSDEAQAYLKEKGCRLIRKATPEAIRAYNECKEKGKIGLFHVTC
jgi:hypothetical protein